MDPSSSDLALRARAMLWICKSHWMAILWRRQPLCDIFCTAHKGCNSYLSSGLLPVHWTTSRFKLSTTKEIAFGVVLSEPSMHDTCTISASLRQGYSSSQKQCMAACHSSRNLVQLLKLDEQDPCHASCAIQNAIPWQARCHRISSSVGMGLVLWQVSLR